MNRNRVLAAAMGIAAAAMVVTGAMATEKKSAAEVMKLVDANLLKVQDSTYDAEVKVIRSGKTVKTMKFEARLKGLFKKKITFTAPGDLAGTAIVTTDDNITYVYMPSYKKVRRVASHVNNQGFMGTDVSGEELGTAALSKGWNATMKSDSATKWVLQLTPEATTQSGYAKMIVTVSKEYGGVEKIESYNKDGKKVKTQVRSGWKTYKDKSGSVSVTVPTLFLYTDHLTGSKTQLKFLGCKVNQSIPDSIFTKRSLMRGN